MIKCCYCGEEKAPVRMRPYGPSGAMTCFDCAMATPEREACAQQQLDRVLNAIEGPLVLTETGFK